MPSKEYRQRMIEEIVESEFVATQSDIAEHLAKRGLKVTQATISRDVTELRLVRIPPVMASIVIALRHYLPKKT